MYILHLHSLKCIIIINILIFSFRSLRVLPKLRYSINSFWKLFRQEWDNNYNCWSIPFMSFSLVYERILKILYYDYNKDQDQSFATKIVLQEFELFTQKTKCMDHEAFVNAWFDIADNWYFYLIYN